MARYATTTELRDEIDLDAADATTISILEAVLDAASQSIDNFCNRPDGFVALEIETSRLYTGTANKVLRIDECVDVLEVASRANATVDEWTAWTSPTLPLEGYIPDGDWIPFTGRAARPDFNALPYTSLMVDPNGDHTSFPQDGALPTIQVTAKWGYSVDVPYVVKQACIMQSARWFKRLEGAMADSLASGDVGRLLYRKAIDPAIEMLLDKGRLILPAIGGRP